MGIRKRIRLKKSAVKFEKLLYAPIKNKIFQSKAFNGIIKRFKQVVDIKIHVFS